MSVRTDPLGPTPDPRLDVSRYDLLLAVMPVPLLVGLLATGVFDLSSHLGVVVGSLLSALVCGYGMFFASPAHASD